MTDALISIAAGESQLGLIEAARRRGLSVIGVDRDPAAAGLARCAAAVRASTHDADAVLAGLEPLRARFTPRAVACQSSGEPAVTAARVARALGLPGLDVEGAAQCASKAGFAALCANAGVPAPAAWILAREQDLAALPPGALVLKPSRGVVGKHGVMRAEHERERAAAYARARAASADGVVVAQALVRGADLSVLAVFDAGATRALATLAEDVEFDADGEACGRAVAVPSPLEGSPAAAAARASTERLAARLGTGLGFFAFRAPAAGEPVAIEAHLDLAGDFVSDVLLARGAGIDPVGALLDVLLERRLPAARPARAARLSFLYEEDRPRIAALRARGDVRADLPPVGRHKGGRIGWLLERGA